jgi:cytochrome c oxidase subunit II
MTPLIALVCSVRLPLFGLWLKDGIQDALNPASTQAAQIERLWWLTFWIMTAAYVLTLLFLGAGVWKRRTTGELPAPELVSDTPAQRRSTIGVGTAIAVTIVLLFLVLFATIGTLKAINAPQSKNPVSIQVTGHQWWWEVRYMSTQADQIVTTANEIHVPVGMPVVIQTSSVDVIHSFWAPNIQGKRDLIPGYQTAVWLQVEREGTFRGQCAEFCGHQHAHMGFFLIAESPDKFQQWLEQQRKPAPEPADAMARRGRDVFLTHPCVMCHTIRGTDAGAHTGPDLTHVASRKTIAAGTLPNNRGNLAAWVVNSQSVKPGNRMPPNPLSPDDLQALLTYLQSLN